MARIRARQKSGSGAPKYLFRKISLSPGVPSLEEGRKRIKKANTASGQAAKVTQHGSYVLI